MTESVSIPFNNCVKFTRKAFSKAIEEKLSRTQTGKYVQGKGRVMKISRIISIGENEISNTSRCVKFSKVKFEVELLNPKVDDVVTATVTSVFQYGLFLDLPIMKVVVPISKMCNMRFIADIPAYKKGDRMIRIGDDVKIVVTNVKYDNERYTCIAKLDT